MRVVIGSLLFSCCLAAQTAVESLQSDFGQLRSGPPTTAVLLNQMTVHILALANSGQPAVGAVQQFSQTLVMALSGHSMTDHVIAGLSEDIQNVMQSTSSTSAAETIREFEGWLAKAGVPSDRAKVVASRLERLGNQPRGPASRSVKRGQSSVEVLQSDLRATGASTASAALSSQVSTHILAMAETTHQPNAATVQPLANELVYAVAGRGLSSEDIDAIVRDVRAVMQSAGTTSQGFGDTVQDFENRLIQAGVPPARAHEIAADLERVGKEVRAPEATTVKP
jgi:hypothetical protein